MKECRSCSHCYVDESQTCSAPTCANNGGPLIHNGILASPVIDGRYELKRRLGRGSMGVVYQARHLLLKSSHAIKVILPDVMGHDDSLPARFRQEAVAAAAIRHPNIIAVTDYGFVDGATPFLVMDLVEGYSLAEILERENPMTPERALALMTPIVAGVGAAHRRGIVHRDLKPLNIMVCDGLPLNEGVKVLDFGLAKIRSNELLGSMVSFKTQGAVGSPYYMPPEQWGEGQPDERSDIYSLGVILYQMLAGRLPFFGGSLPELMKQHLLQPPSEEGLTHLPDALLKVLSQALAKAPEDRFPDAGSFIGAFHQSLAAPASPARSPKRRAASLADTITLDDGKLPADHHELTLTEARREVEAARRQAEEAARQHAEADAQRLVAEESLRRKAAKIAEERAAAEAARQAAEAEAARQAAEAEAARLQAEAEARQQAEAEARRHAEEAQRAAEETRRRFAEAASQRAAAEARQRAAEEALQQQAAAVAQQQAAAIVQQETAEAARQTAVEAHQTVEEAARLQAEAQTQQQMAEGAWLQAEAAARQREATIARLQAEAAAEHKAAEEARQASAKAQQEMANAARLQAAAEAQERSAEATRQHAEELARQRVAEAARLQSDLEARQHAFAETQQQFSETLLRQAAAETQQRAAEKLAQEKLLATQRIDARDLPARTASAPAPNRHDAVTALDFLLPPDGAAAIVTPALAVTPAAQVQDAPVSALAPGDATPAVNTASAAANPVLARSLFKAWGPDAETLTLSSPRKLLLLLLPAVVFLGLAWLLLQRACAGESNVASSVGLTAAQPPSGMALLPGGVFEMGRSDVPEESKEYPAHRVSVKSFYLDETEVTNGEYARFLQAAGHPAPDKPPPARGELLWRDWTGNQPPAGQEQWPVRNVSIAEAQAFAAWRSQRDGLVCRLPTEEEWEFAARGGQPDNLYPWGRSWIDGHANMKKYDAANPNQPAAARSFPNDRAAAGVFDLIGNVHEWTSSKASYYESNAKRVPPAEQSLPVIRGGAYSVAQDLNAASRQWTPQAKDPAIGFRLACELREEKAAPKK